MPVQFTNSSLNPSLIDFVATQDIPAYSFVTSDGKIVDSSISGTRNKNIGITSIAVLNGFPGKAIQSGQVYNPSWLWTTRGPLYVNGNSISETGSTMGFSQCVGVIINMNTIEVNIHTAYIF